jgi:low temperature requirement protein LtrA
MVAGIIAFAAGQRTVLTHPLDATAGASAWMILGGCSIYLAGHALFKVQVFRAWSWSRLGGAAVLLGAALVGPALPALLVGVFAVLVMIGVAVADKLLHPQAAA